VVPSEQLHAMIERVLEVGLQFRKHRKTVSDMECSDNHGNAGREERACDIKRTWNLVRLYADQHDQAAVPPQLRQQLCNPNARVYFVDKSDVDGGVGAEHASAR